jgi:hypothetical protein
VEINDGTFYGRRGANWVGTNVELFYGGPDRDIVDVNLAYGADVLDGPRSGTFYGRGGDDHVKRNSRAFHGGRGRDSVARNAGNGIFRGGPGRDTVDINRGLVRGGKGNDHVELNRKSGTFYGIACASAPPGRSQRWCANGSGPVAAPASTKPVPVTTLSLFCPK